LELGEGDWRGEEEGGDSPLYVPKLNVHADRSTSMDGNFESPMYIDCL